MITKKPGLMALFAAILMLISSCSKSPVEHSNPHSERKSSTHFAFWNGYNFFSATGDHYSNVFQKYPSPEIEEQKLMELSFYTSYGLKEMIANYSSGSVLLDDLKTDIQQNDNLLFAEEFFGNHPQHLAAMDQILLTAFGIQYSSLLNPIIWMGKENRIAFGCPEFAQSSESAANPVIAFTAELPQPDSTTVVRIDEKLGADYYDDDDFIPCFYPSSNEIFPEYLEAMVGFDDYYYNTNNLILNPEKWIIVIQPIPSIIGSDGKIQGDYTEGFTATEVRGNNPPDRTPGCEKGSSLELHNLQILNRFQRFGKSRVRLKKNVQHLHSPHTWQFEHSFNSGNPGVLKIANLKKNEIPSNLLKLPYHFQGVDYNKPNYQNRVNIETDHSPYGYSFFPILYEHDWYSFMAIKTKTVYNPHLNDFMHTSVNMRKEGDWYACYYVDVFDWCFGSTVNFDKSSKQKSMLYAGNK